MKKILIIENETFVADRYKNRLESMYQVEVAPDGQSGFYAIYDCKPDAVLLDTNIPQMNAVSIVGKMRAQKQFKKLPILLLVDAYSCPIAEDALTAGANEAFNKNDPKALNHLLSTLSDLLSPFLSKRKESEAAASARSSSLTLTAPVPEMVPSPSPSEPEFESPPARRAPAEAYSATRSEAAVAMMPEEASATLTDTALEEAAPAETDSDDLTPLFLQEFGTNVHKARTSFLQSRVSKNQVEQQALFAQFRKKISSLRAESGQCGLTALMGFLFQIEKRAEQLEKSLATGSATSLQILARAVDLLASMDNHRSELGPLNHLAPSALVVDDENVSRKAISLGLEKANIRVVPASSPQMALDECASKPFDAIFLDVEMPGMSGFALCARIRTIQQHKETPITFVTSLDDLNARTSSRISGGNFFITKPVNYFDLAISALTAMFKRRLSK